MLSCVTYLQSGAERLRGLIAGPLRELAGRQADCQRGCGLQAAHLLRFNVVGEASMSDGEADSVASPVRGGAAGSELTQGVDRFASHLCKPRSIMHVKVTLRINQADDTLCVD